MIGGTGDAQFDPVAAGIYRLYRTTLDRDPEPPGLLGWSDRLMSGAAGLSEVTAGFVNSAEFRSLYGQTDNATFVTLLYANVLGRSPDPAGLAHWTGLLDRGARSREEVVTGFSDSLEFRTKTEAAALRFSREGNRISRMMSSGFTARSSTATRNCPDCWAGRRFWPGGGPMPR